MNILTALRVLVGLATIAVGVWLFVRLLPVLDFQVLVLCLAAGLAIIEAPRFLKAYRQRKLRIATYVEENVSAKTTLRRANRFGLWSWICYAVAPVWVIVGFVLFGRPGFIITFGIAFALIAIGFALSLYRGFARTSVEFRSINAVKPAITPAKLWITSLGLLAVIVAALIAGAVWHIDAMNWLYGVGAIFLIGATIWRYLRGWPNDPDPPPS